MKRFYREYHVDSGLHRFEIKEGASDLWIAVSAVDEQEALEALARHTVRKIRKLLLAHIAVRPEFETSMTPLAYDGECDVLYTMYEAGKRAQVGPMASVAGIVSEMVGKAFIKKYPSVEILVENGGDLFVSSQKERHIAVYAGDSVFSNRIMLKITPEMMPIGICTSAGTLGHSISYGKADAVVVLSKDTALADAVATAVGNIVQSGDDVQIASESAMKISGVSGAVVICQDKLAAAGQIIFV